MFKLPNPFRRKPRPPETGRANAARFVAAVHELAHSERMVQMYPHPGYRGEEHSRYNWQWMPNASWQLHVLLLLDEADLVKDATFHAPDDLAGWTFTAVSAVPVPRVAKLTLEDVL